ncbi:hypothetical protein [Chitinophaga vietnamensis]|uniref:hypothetical protein n=1 Tax=Chitinophaga vietnamensis TaxID=2593957 RepID=UPI001177D5DB|nr:hypothetical protein [Chitinophaga vietnamensis]
MKHFIFFLLLCSWCAQLLAQQREYKLNPFRLDNTIRRAKFDSSVKILVSNVNTFVMIGGAAVSKKDLGLDTAINLTGIFSGDLPGISGILAGMKEGNGEEGTVLDKKKAVRHFREIVTGRRANKVVAVAAHEKAIRRADSLHEALTRHCNDFFEAFRAIRRYVSAEDYIDTLLLPPFIEDTLVFKSNLQHYMCNSVNAGDTNINRIRMEVEEEMNNLASAYVKAKGVYRLLNVPATIEEKAAVKVKITAPAEGFTVRVEKDKSAAIDNKQSFSKDFDLLTKKFEQIDSKRIDIIAKANRGVDLYYRVMNATFTVVACTVTLDSDLVTVRAQLKDRAGKLIKEFDPIIFRTDGGWKIDMSTGYLLSFRGDENYTYVYDGKGVTGVQKNRGDMLKHAVGLMFHAYQRKAKGLTYGGSVGISAPTDGQSIGFYFGASLFMMARNRLVLTAGCAFNRFKLLNTANLEYDNEASNKSQKATYKFTNVNNTEINYDQVYRPAFFIGFTYNIFSLKK